RRRQRLELRRSDAAGGLRRRRPEQNGEQLARRLLAIRTPVHGKRSHPAIAASRRDSAAGNRAGERRTDSPRADGGRTSADDVERRLFREAFYLSPPIGGILNSDRTARGPIKCVQNSSP